MRATFSIMAFATTWALQMDCQYILKVNSNELSALNVTFLYLIVVLHQIQLHLFQPASQVNKNVIHIFRAVSSG